MSILQNYDSKKDFSLCNTQDVLDNLKSNIQNGLSEREAAERIRKFGHNEFTEKEQETIWEKLIEQFDDPMVKLLLIAAVVSFIISYFSSMHGQESDLPIWIEPFVIFLILIANGFIGLYQDYNADQSIQTLQGMQSRFCNVLRDGKWSQKDTKTLTIGDIVKIKIGEVCPADIRLVKVNSLSLSVNQSALNGESIPRNKTAEKCTKIQQTYDQRNMVFSGTQIIFGNGIGIVVRIGEETELGKVKVEIEKAQEDTKDQLSPLKKQLNDFGDFLAKAIAVICLLIWLISFPYFSDKVHGGFILGSLYYFKQAVALGVAAIPEGLPAVITTCLALGTRRMIKKNALVRKLPSVETLGCTTVICADKTGTMTQNEMVVKKFAIFNDQNQLTYCSVSGQCYSSDQDITLDQSLKPMSPNLTLFMKTCIENNESKIVNENGKNQCQGVSTEGALLSLGNSSLNSQLIEDKQFSEIATLHFTSNRKQMSLLARDQDSKKNYLLVKGAAEIILQNSMRYMNQKGEELTLTEEVREGILKDIKQLSLQGYRVLAVSLKQGDQLGNMNDLKDQNDTSHPIFQYVMHPDNTDEIENDTTFLGFVCIEDPVKNNLKLSVQQAKEAGITLIMITGDSQFTALSIGKQVDMIDQNYDIDQTKKQQVYTGQQLDNLNDIDLTQILCSSVLFQRSLIFARTTPAHKRRIVKSLVAQEEIVAMTGDGVNDAPALSQASIGIAMGISGSDVAKESSDLILMDDNFATIISAVEEGRSIYANMKAFIRYMISSNIGEVISIFITSLLGIPEGFNSIQLLWVNLVTDGLPATALSFNEPDPDVLKRPPRKKDEKIVDRWIFTRYMIVGLYVGIATAGIFIYYYCNYDWSNYQHSLVTFDQLRNWTKCSEWKDVIIKEYENNCDYFLAGKKKASTLSLTVLVMIEMFNSVNAISEDQSIFTVGVFSNMWLWGAIVCSTLLHCMILYIPIFEKIFGTVPLDVKDWSLVIIFTLPVIWIEEILKYVSREKNRKERLKRNKRIKK